MGRAFQFSVVFVLVASAWAFAQSSGSNDGLAAHRPPARQGPPRIWVVQPTPELVEYTAALTPGRRVKLPVFAFVGPAMIQANRRGEVIAWTPDGLLMIWNGTRWLERSLPTIRPIEGDVRAHESDSSRTWLLGASGNSLFLMEAESRVWRNHEYGWADSAVVASRLEEFDFDLHPRRTVFEFPFIRCEDNPDEYEFFTQRCFDPFVTVPGGGVDDFFVLTRPEPEVLSYQYGNTAAQAWIRSELYTRKGKGWMKQPRAPMEVCFDKGATELGIEPDDAQGTESNTSSDRAWIRRFVDPSGLRSSERAVEFFDEWTGYGSRQSESDFYPDNPLPNPSRRRVAFTVRGPAIRNPGWKEAPDSLEKRRMELTLADLPVAEVVTLDPAPVRTWRQPHAEFAGWIDDDRLVILEHGALVGVDVRTGRRTELGVRVRGLRDVLVVDP